MTNEAQRRAVGGYLLQHALQYPYEYERTNHDIQAYFADLGIQIASLMAFRLTTQAETAPDAGRYVWVTVDPTDAGHYIIHYVPDVDTSGEISTFQQAGLLLKRSIDGGFTFADIYNPTPYLPVPPDLSHFLVDNPGVIRNNGIRTSGGNLGLSVDDTANIYAGGILGTASGLALPNPTSLYSDGALFSLRSGAQEDQSALYYARRRILPFGGLEWKRIAVSGDQSFAVGYFEQDPGTTPALSLDETTPDLEKIILNMPPIPQNTNGETTTKIYLYSTLPAPTAAHLGALVIVDDAAVPDVTFASLFFCRPDGSGGYEWVGLESANQVQFVIGHLFDVFTTTYTQLAATATPRLLITESTETLSGSLKKTNIDLGLPAPATADHSIVCPDSGLPGSGTIKDYYQNVDANGTFMPFTVPSGCAVEIAGTTGLWGLSTFNSGLLTATRVVDAHGDTAGGRDVFNCYNGQLIIRTYHPDLLALGDPIDPFVEPYILDADRKICLQMQAPNAGGTGNAGFGQMCVHYRIYAADLAHWCVLFDMTSVDGSFMGTITGIEWATHVNGSGWVAECVPGNYSGTIAAYIERSFSNATITKITVTYDETPITGATYSYHNFLADDTGEFDTWPLVNVSGAVHVWSGSRGMSKLQIGLFASRDGCTSAAATIKSVKIEGLAANPFGTSNC